MKQAASRGKILDFGLVIAVFVAVIFAASFYLSLWRHISYGSSSHDLGIFAQATWQICTGNAPISSFLGVHILADHASFFLYVLSAPYCLLKSPSALLFFQSLFIALGCIPLALIGRHKGLKNQQIAAVLLAYALYPVVINITLFDFHPDVLAVPLFFVLFLTFELKNVVFFCASLLAIASTKAVLSLTLMSYGLAILLLKKEKKFGLIALGFGVFWYVFAAKYIINLFGEGRFAIDRHAGHFKGLGSSSTEIMLNALGRPDVTLPRIFSGRTMDFLGKVFLPVAYVIAAINKNYWFYLVASLPTLAICLLSTSNHYVSDSRMYMLPLVPFLMLMVIDYYCWSNHRLPQRFVQIPLLVGILVSVIAFEAFTDTLELAEELDQSVQARADALDRLVKIVPAGQSVLTSDKVAPHLSNRNSIRILDASADQKPEEFNYILLDKIVPGWLNSERYNQDVYKDLLARPGCTLIDDSDEAALFQCREKSD